MSDKIDALSFMSNLSRQIKAGEITFEQGVDEMFKANPTTKMARIDYTSHLWKFLGQPSDEQLLAWEEMKKN